MQAVLLLAVLLLCQHVVTRALFEADRGFALTIMQVLILVTVLTHGCVLWTVMRCKNLSLRQLFHPCSMSARAALLRVVPAALMLAPGLVVAVALALTLLVRIAPLSPSDEAFFGHMTDPTPAAGFALCLMAPLLEEMLFRGIVLRGFLQRYPRWWAIFGSAVLFGVAHLNIYQFVAAMVLGTVLGWLYERVRSLIPCISLHAAYNAGVLLLANKPAPAARAATGWTLLLALLVSACGAFMLRRMLTEPAILAPSP